MVQRNGVWRSPRRGVFGSLASLCLLLFVLLAIPALALADEQRVTASSDAGLPQTQARSQALERALVEAVFSQAKAMLPGPVTEARLAALRAHLAPRSIDYVQSYHEVVAKPREGQEAEQPKEQAKNQAAPAIELVLDVEVRRPALRETLVRLGFFAGTHHPGSVALSLGPGISPKDAQALEPLDVLLGLTRSARAKTSVSLERLPQGYYKAVLRQGAIVLAVDASDVPNLWLAAFAKFFADRQQQEGPGPRVLSMAGFASADAVMDFLRLLGTWDSAVQEPSLVGMDLDGAGVAARFSCRVVSQANLDGLLRQALAERKLRLLEQDGNPTP